MKKILIIDDDEQVREMISLFLREAGYQTFTAANGREGEQLYLSEGADMLILDLYMPEQSGLETLIRLKNQETNIKIIAMSGGYRENYRSEYKGAEDITVLAKKYGALRTFTKPMKLRLLLESVQELIGPP